MTQPQFIVAGTIQLPSIGSMQHFMLAKDDHVIRIAHRHQDSRGVYYRGRHWDDCIAAFPVPWRDRWGMHPLSEPLFPVKVMSEAYGLFCIQKGTASARPSSVAGDNTTCPVLFTPCEGSTCWGLLRDGERIAVIQSDKAAEYLLKWRPGLAGYLKRHTLLVNKDGWQPAGKAPLEAMMEAVAREAAVVRAAGGGMHDPEPLQSVPVDF